MDILITYDESAYKNGIAAVQNSCSIVQEAVDSFKALNVGKLNADELLELFVNPANLVYKKITGGTVKIGELQLQSAKAMELLEKPKGYDSFIAKIDECTTSLKQVRTAGNYPLAGERIREWFTLAANGKIVFNEERGEAEKSRYKHYAKSEAAKAMYNFAKAIIKKYEECNIKKVKGGQSLGALINSLVNEESMYRKSLALNEREIMKYN